MILRSAAYYICFTEHSSINAYILLASSAFAAASSFMRALFICCVFKALMLATSIAIFSCYAASVASYDLWSSALRSSNYSTTPSSSCFFCSMTLFCLKISASNYCIADDYFSRTAAIYIATSASTAPFFSFAIARYNSISRSNARFNYARCSSSSASIFSFIIFLFSWSSFSSTSFSNYLFLLL